MAIQIVPYDKRMETAVAAFNARLRAADVSQRFPERHVSDWLPPQEGRRLFMEFHLAVDDECAVRGGYGLKHQEFQIGPLQTSIGFITLPLSEGIVDRRFAILGTHLLSSAVARQPLLYALGMGGEGEAITQIVRAAGWRVSSVPFFFRVVRPFRFLRNIHALRNSPLRRAGLNALAFSGLGWLSFKALRTAQWFRIPHHAGVSAELVDGFDDWADELWQDCAADYPYTAVRDAATLKILYPRGSERFLCVKVVENSRPIGWAVLLATGLSGHKQFGNMRLGSIVDVFARPQDAEKIIAAADRLLTARKVDLIVSNQAHRSWCAALRRNGFLSGPSNFLLATSRKLTELMNSRQIGLEDLHVNRGDGDGPINL